MGTHWVVTADCCNQMGYFYGKLFDIHSFIISPCYFVSHATISSSGDSEDKEFVPRSDAAAAAAAEAAGAEGDDGEISYSGPSPSGFSRSDCFKVEKHLLVYGWGRWQDIKVHGRLASFRVNDHGSITTDHSVSRIYKQF